MKNNVFIQKIHKEPKTPVKLEFSKTNYTI